MNRAIAILRGINVGGKRRILMTDLKLLLENSGFVNVKTYIQTGNVIFDSSNKLSNIELANKIEKAILAKYEFSVPTIVMSAKELEKSIKNNPYYNKGKDSSKLHLTFLKKTPTKENKTKAESYHYEPDRFIIEGRNAYVFCEGKYHKSKYTNKFFESKLKIYTTTRNWKTVLKLLELSV